MSLRLKETATMNIDELFIICIACLVSFLIGAFCGLITKEKYGKAKK